MDETYRVGLIYGGRSPEHEVSIQSARNVARALRDAGHTVTPIRISPDGAWRVEDGPDALLADAAGGGTPLLFPAEAHGRLLRQSADGRLGEVEIDVAFPVLHGQNGEDGRVQGLLQTLGVPYVGPDVLGSAVCMDKDVAKRLLVAAGVPVAAFATVRRTDRDGAAFEALAERLGTPLFVKPANSGSSVGVTKVEAADAFGPALDLAFRYDRKVLVEEAVVGREIEVAVLGNEEPQASAPGEIVSTAQFYTYEAKYQDADAARMEVPADLPADVAERLRQLAVETYTTLGCEGMARVDFFLADDGRVLVNEVNTIPGFTARSMYPVMWEQAGLTNADLADTLVRLAVARHRRDAAIETSR